MNGRNSIKDAWKFLTCVYVQRCCAVAICHATNSSYQQFLLFVLNCMLQLLQCFTVQKSLSVAQLYIFMFMFNQCSKWEKNYDIISQNTCVPLHTKKATDLHLKQKHNLCYFYWGTALTPLTRLVQGATQKFQKLECHLKTACSTVVRY
jgi:hypothetical protein